MRLSLEEKRIAHTLWLRYFVMLSSSELLCNRMTQRDTERVGAFFVAFNGHTNVSCCGNLSMKREMSKGSVI
jgi:hypothetical protein